MILGTDYRFNAMYETDTTAIELLAEAYRGVIYHYTAVSVKELEDGTAKIIFGYNILNPGKYKADKLKGDKYFEEHLGLILNTLILDTVEIENANGESDSEVLDEGGEVQP